MRNIALLQELKSILFSGSQGPELAQRVLEKLNEHYYDKTSDAIKDDGSILDTLIAFQTEVETYRNSQPEAQLSPLQKSLEKAINAYTPFATKASKILSGLAGLTTALFKYALAHPFKTTAILFLAFAVSGVDAKPRRRFSEAASAEAPLTTAVYDTQTTRLPPLKELLQPALSFSEDLEAPTREAAEKKVLSLVTNLIENKLYEFSARDLKERIDAGLQFRIESAGDLQKRPLAENKHMALEALLENPGTGILRIPAENLQSDFCHDATETQQSLVGLLHEELTHAQVYAEGGPQCAQHYLAKAPKAFDFAKTLLFKVQGGKLHLSEETLAPFVKKDLKNIASVLSNLVNFPEMTSIATPCQVMGIKNPRTGKIKFSSRPKTTDRRDLLENHIEVIRAELKKGSISEVEAYILMLPKTLQRQLFPKYSQARQKTLEENIGLCLNLRYFATKELLEECQHKSTLSKKDRSKLEHNLQENERQLRFIDEKKIDFEGTDLLEQVTQRLRTLLTSKQARHTSEVFKSEKAQRTAATEIPLEVKTGKR